MGGTLPSTGMWQGEVFAISDCLVDLFVISIYCCTTPKLVYTLLIVPYKYVVKTTRYKYESLHTYRPSSIVSLNIGFIFLMAINYI